MADIDITIVEYSLKKIIPHFISENDE